MRIIGVFPAMLLLTAIAAMGSCGGKNSPSNVQSPGGDKPGKDQLLNAGSGVIQDKTPLTQFTAYLNGFHFYNGNINGQMEAHHYVQQLNEDLYQAIIFDGNSKDAKIMGVEYIVTHTLFDSLPQEEKKLWHSHRHEVLSGSLIAPGLPEDVETKLMEKLVNTYGKTIHTWHTDQERTLPIGAPMLMMGFTRDGQLKQDLVDDRDNRFDVKTAEKRRERASILAPQIDSAADSWQRGEIRQFIISNRADSAKAVHRHR